MAFRAFYALPVESFTARGGQATNAVYGFLSMLVKMIETERPTHIAVAFDLGRHSFRTEVYPEYKGTRDETPPEFRGQVEIIQELLASMGIKTLTKENYEADDILATLAKDGGDQGMRVLVASGDRDTFQLVNDNVTVLYPGRSASDLNYMTPAAIEERYGVTPRGYSELAALVGETSDNLPGVPGVGPKTAAGWLQKFGGLDGLLESSDKIGGKRGEALRDHLEDVRRNRQLNHLLDDLDLGVDLAQLEPTGADHAALQRLFDTLDFRGLRSRVYRALAIEAALDADAIAGVGGADEVLLQDVTFADSDLDIDAWLADNVGEAPLALAYRGIGKPVIGNLEGLALLADGQALVVDTAEVTPAQETALANFLAAGPQLIMHGGKAAWHAFKARGWALPQPVFDVELAAYLCRPERRGYSLGELSSEYLGEDLPEEQEDALFSLEDLEAEQGNAPAWVSRLAGEAQAVGRLRAPLEARLQEQHMLPLLTAMEIPLQTVLGRMEDRGVAMDVPMLDDLSAELGSEARRAESDAFEAIGHSANLASPKQLQVILFEELGMPKTRKTQTGWTTDAAALSDLFVKTEHPFLAALLRHRDNTKLMQMVDGLRAEVRPDGRIHTTFLQTVAATGRLASAEPNLQNIPARTATGMRVRDAFVAGEGFVYLMSVDYSQIEMRIMAHLSEDAALIEAFNSGEDLHRTMAAMVFGVPVTEVTPELRGRIKATSYGLAYGLSPFGLSRQLGTSVEEARGLHASYFQRFGGIGRYLHEVVETARETGYTETMFGRRRYFPELTSANHRIREIAERAALNAPIQGSAADIIKVATAGVEDRLKAEGLKSRIILQIHDELLLEIAPSEAEAVTAVVREEMASPVQMSVPLEVAVGLGPSWKAAAH